MEEEFWCKSFTLQSFCFLSQVFSGAFPVLPVFPLGEGDHAQDHQKIKEDQEHTHHKEQDKHHCFHIRYPLAASPEKQNAPQTAKSAKRIHFSVTCFRIQSGASGTSL